MSKALIYVELSAKEKEQALEAFKVAHANTGGVFEPQFAPDRAWVEGYTYARAALAAQPGSVPDSRPLRDYLKERIASMTPEQLAAFESARVRIQESLAAAPTEAKPAPAPGYCKHCKQYTIEEPLPAQDAVDAALAYLDDLKDDAAAHIWPDDLELCQTSECVVQVASVRMGSPDGMTVPLFSREQVADAIRAAISAKKGGQP